MTAATQAKAQRLVDEGRVSRPDPERPRLFAVRGDSREYRVVVGLFTAWCDCPAGEAIAHLNEALAILNRPGEGLGYSYGLKRGQAGYFMLVRARDHLAYLRDDFERLEGRRSATGEDSS